MGKRRTSRELAMKLLYQAEINPGDYEDRARLFWEGNPCREEVRQFTMELVRRVFDKKKEIDELLAKYSEHWTLDRMTVIDRSILRLAVSELVYCPNIPPKVAIDEALEIAKKYGCKDSPNFINGVLDKILKELTQGFAPSSAG